MAVIHKLGSPYLTYLSGIVRNRESGPSEIRDALLRLGEEVGSSILAECFLRQTTITTPMEEHVESLAATKDLSVVITTRFDLETFGSTLSASLVPSKLGFMNFEGRRGFDALNSPVREIELPDLRNRTVDSVVIAKSCLATGCTAVSLARTALQEYMPRRMILVAVFYSLAGLRELEDSFPHSEIFVVGEPDEIDGEGILHPGVGLLEARM
ncbi:uracil phosphoribosyltransferase [Glycomyces xiaoerkulensis]|uniref:uracil phosphoribosyltransferase n=1 Tax=Glycomyces xiaoerkulensis TaxID=2038139 RepID=UPI000C258C5A|nr:uracil phosphoribosyltransferase [Glycomyces xiaoerkulensis]